MTGQEILTVPTKSVWSGVARIDINELSKCCGWIPPFTVVLLIDISDRTLSIFANFIVPPCEVGALLFSKWQPFIKTELPKNCTTPACSNKSNCWLLVNVEPIKNTFDL